MSLPDLSPERQKQLRYMHEHGASVAALVAEFGIGRRTVYRYLEGSFMEGHVGQWTATFRIGPDEQPHRVSPWVKAA